MANETRNKVYKIEISYLKNELSLVDSRDKAGKNVGLEASSISLGER